MDHFKNSLTLTACIGLLCLCGCFGSNSNVGLVSGTITVDGEPIDRAVVSFFPTQGRGSIGMTDENGFYELAYVLKQNGAVIGNHKVTIETKVDRASQYDVENGSEKGGSRKELLPEKYHNHKKTELTATVQSGSNTIDFALTTE